jgi:quercetin dioxygenase-like cupin family protein
MKMRRLFETFMLALILSVSAAAQTPHPASPAPGQNVEDMKFSPVPGLPACVTASVQNGDPSKGASILLGKLTSGCSIPWHWHTPNEHLMLVKGVARVEMKDSKSITLREGGFALMPSRHVHQFLCETTCLLYVYSDVAFDIHYVDAQGKEIPPADALKQVKETSP